jgi:hypothetical protein
MKFVNVLFIVLLAGAFLACKKHKDNKVEVDHPFVRYVETRTITSDLVALDMVRTADGGYLILGSSPQETSQYHRIYVLKVDAAGNYVWDSYLPEPYYNPVSSLIAKDGAWLLFCMDDISTTRLIQIKDAQANIPEQLAIWPDLVLPLHASATPDGGFLVLNSHLADKWTGLTKLGSNLKEEWTAQYDYNESFAPEIDRHVKGEIAPLPFITGTVTTDAGTVAYFFNAHYDANLSTMFVNPSDGSLDGFGYLGGDRSFATMKTILPLGGTRFAFTRYDRSNNNFFIPNLTFDYKAGLIKAISGLGGQKFPDMETGARVVCQKQILLGREVLIYGTNTKNNGIGLYFFDARSGVYLGNKTLSLETPFELGGFAPSTDGGLMVMAKTYIVNRFARVCLLKLSVEDLTKVFGG